MKIVKQFDNAFVKGFLNDWKNLSKNEAIAINNRKYILNGDFRFTEAVIKRLRVINNMLRKEELRIKEQSLKIFIAQERMLKKQVIDDYEIDTTIHCWSESHYKSLHEDFDGNPFYKDYNLHIFGKEKSDQHFTNNWNEFENNPNHPLAGEQHCYLFHHLSDHTAMAWEDILRIDEIWIEITVRNQFFSTLGNKLNNN